MRASHRLRGIIPFAALLPLLAGVALHAAAAPTPVQAGVTTGDQSKLLSRGKDAAFGAARRAGVVIEVDPAARYQEMAGFGAAITDTSAELIQNRLAALQRAALTQELFGHDAGGIGLSLTRLQNESHFEPADSPGMRVDPAKRAAFIGGYLARCWRSRIPPP